MSSKTIERYAQAAARANARSQRKEKELVAVKQAMVNLALERNALFAALMVQQDGPLLVPMDKFAEGRKIAHLVRDRHQMEPESGMVYWVWYVTTEEQAALEADQAEKAAEEESAPPLLMGPDGRALRTGKPLDSETTEGSATADGGQDPPPDELPPPADSTSPGLDPGDADLHEDAPGA